MPCVRSQKWDEEPMRNELPRLGGLRPVVGRIKDIPEDFCVDEVPSYLPSGNGTHLFVRIEKRGLTTQQAMRALSEHTKCATKAMGAAGQKDKVAVTTQWISLEGVDPETCASFAHESLRILECVPNETKLRTGHLRGNRFRVRVRGVDADDVAQVLAEGMALDKGVPNYFGTQRFGRDGDNAERAKAWLVDGGRPPRDRFKRKLFVSSLQSAAFNEVLAQRVESGHVHAALEGDVFQTQRRGIFSDPDAAANAVRMASWEISPTGPMFGGDMRWGSAACEEMERKVEAEYGFCDEVYARMGKLGRGTRRTLRIRPQELAFEPAEDGFWVTFELPSGAYATVVLREILADAPSSK